MYDQVDKSHQSENLKLEKQLGRHPFETILIIYAFLFKKIIKISMELA